MISGPRRPSLDKSESRLSKKNQIRRTMFVSSSDYDTSRSLSVAEQ